MSRRSGIVTIVSVMALAGSASADMYWGAAELSEFDMLGSLDGSLTAQLGSTSQWTAGSGSAATQPLMGNYVYYSSLTIGEGLVDGGEDPFDKDLDSGMESGTGFVLGGGSGSGSAPGVGSGPDEHGTSVPTPGALLLGVIGIGLVELLRRKHL